MAGTPNLRHNVYMKILRVIISTGTAELSVRLPTYPPGRTDTPGNSCGG